MKKKLLNNTLSKRICTFLLVGFFLINLISFFHAYTFTHFADSDIQKTKSPEKLGPLEKLKSVLLGVNNPRPINKSFPSQAYKTITLQSNKIIECWEIDSLFSKGTVAVFHGYSGEKSSMLDKAVIFSALGYNTLLVDFMGSGGSEGNQTTLGFKEAEEVKTVVDYLIAKGEKNIILFGTSMGAAAIMKALDDYSLPVNAIIIECPFGSMYETTCARFDIMNVPPFPLAGFLVFWGGVQNNFWAFDHKPVEYAKSIACPTLLLYGEQDKNVSRKEIDEIFKNLKGPKKLETYEHAGHENYLLKYKKEWCADITGFLNEINQKPSF